MHVGLLKAGPFCPLFADFSTAFLEARNAPGYVFIIPLDSACPNPERNIPYSSR